MFNSTLKRAAGVTLLLLLLFILAQPGAAQENPPRQQYRAAPERSPVILQQEVTPAGTTTSLAIPASADTYIASEYPAQNFGDDALYLGYNLAGNDYFGAQRMLLRFDVDGALPDDAIIENATLRLRLFFASPTDDEAMGTVLRRLGSAWEESTVTWNSEPAWTPVYDTIYVGHDLTWYEWDVADLAREWQEGVHPNNGLEIIGDEKVQQRERAFYARETSTDYYPRLLVEYTVSDDEQPPEITVEPLPPFVQRDFSVAWSGSDPGSADIAYYDVEVRIDEGAWQEWLSGTTQTEMAFGQGENGRFYQFRARGVDEAGNVEPFGVPEAETTVDTRPPATTIDPLPPLTSQSQFAVTWSGGDAVSGIEYYDVAYRYNDESWTLWLPQTLATSATFYNAADGLYRFEVRAVDRVDQVEPFFQEAEASIIVDHDPPFVEPKLWLPLIIHDDF